MCVWLGFTYEIVEQPVKHPVLKICKTAVPTKKETSLTIIYSVSQIKKIKTYACVLTRLPNPVHKSNLKYQITKFERSLLE